MGAYRASSAGNVGTVGLRGHYVAAVVTEGRRGRAGAGNDVGGAPELRWRLRVSEGGAGKLKMGRGMARAGAGGVKAAFRRVVAYAIRALATRGHFPLHTVAMA